MHGFTVKANYVLFLFGFFFKNCNAFATPELHVFSDTFATHIHKRWIRFAQTGLIKMRDII